MAVGVGGTGVLVGRGVLVGSGVLLGIGVKVAVGGTVFVGGGTRVAVGAGVGFAHAVRMHTNNISHSIFLDTVLSDFVFINLLLYSSFIWFCVPTTRSTGVSADHGSFHVIVTDRTGVFCSGRECERYIYSIVIECTVIGSSGGKAVIF